MLQEERGPLIAFIDGLIDKESECFTDVDEVGLLERYITIDVDDIEFEFIGQVLRLTCRVVIDFEDPGEDGMDIAGGIVGS